MFTKGICSGPGILQVNEHSIINVIFILQFRLQNPCCSSCSNNPSLRDFSFCWVKSSVTRNRKNTGIRFSAIHIWIPSSYCCLVCAHCNISAEAKQIIFPKASSQIVTNIRKRAQNVTPGIHHVARQDWNIHPSLHLIHFLYSKSTYC